MTEYADLTRRAEQYAATVADLETRLKALYHDAVRRLAGTSDLATLADLNLPAPRSSARAWPYLDWIDALPAQPVGRTRRCCPT